MNKFINVFDDTHIFRMTDDTGMFQHARFSIPDLLEGYTTDDNARALIMAVMLYEKSQKPEYLALIYRYLAFVLYAQNEKGRFRNFMLYNRQFREKEGSEDCLGRCMWALGYTHASTLLPSGIKEACSGAIHRALPNIQQLTWLRSQAYSLIGLSFIESPAVDGMICELSEALCTQFETHTQDADWQWFEDNITYDNAVLPWALFAVHKRLGNSRVRCVASQSLSFLHSVTFQDGFFRPIGCNGWLLRGAAAARHDEQPLEACTTTLAYLAAYESTGDEAMMELARKAFSWYRGENSRGESLIDHATGGCYDGITPDGLNQNQGAESIVSYAIAMLALTKGEAALVRKKFSGCER